MIVDVKVPSPGESVTKVQILQWFVEDGAAVDRDAPLVELETEKATLVVSAEVAGRVRHAAEVGATLAVGTVIARIEPGGSVGAPATVGTAPAAPSGASAGGRGGPASPSAAKILRERGLDPASVTGSGRGGRITRSDALSAPDKPPAPPPVLTPVPVGPPVGAPSPRPGERREPMSSLRQALARRLVAVRNETAMLTTFNEIDMDPVQRLRASLQAGFQAEHGIKLGYMSLFARAVCLAIAEWPRVNAFIEGYEIVSHDFVDLGVAVSTDRGLMVPIVRGAHAKGLGALEQEIQRLALRAREGRIALEDLSGGTFTLTNGGIFGSLLSTPILNPPQSAILGMHAVQDRPVARDGQVVIRPMMYVALSYDHRIIDGREAVSFLKRIKTAVETPETLVGDP